MVRIPILMMKDSHRPAPRAGGAIEVGVRAPTPNVAQITIKSDPAIGTIEEENPDVEMTSQDLHLNGGPPAMRLNGRKVLPGGRRAGVGVGASVVSVVTVVVKPIGHPTTEERPHLLASRKASSEESDLSNAVQVKNTSPPLGGKQNTLIKTVPIIGDVF